jgi:hypothetical protein
MQLASGPDTINIQLPSLTGETKASTAQVRSELSHYRQFYCQKRQQKFAALSNSILCDE